MPARGPLPIQRMSLAILSSETATVRTAPLAATTLSIVLCAWKWLDVSRSPRPVRSLMIVAARAAGTRGAC